MWSSDKYGNHQEVDKYKLLAENTVECIWLLDLKNERYKFISPSITNLRGLTVEEAMNEKLSDSLTPESLEKVYRITEQRLSRYLKGDLSDDVMEGVDEFQQYCKDGSIIDVEISTKYLYNPDTDFIDVLGVSRDITERKKLESKLNEEIKEKNKLIVKLKKSEDKLSRITKELLDKNEILKNIAVTDQLTGIYNRYFFDKTVLDEMYRSDRYENSLSMIIFDLDHFKKINDSWGHDVGDRVLIMCAAVAKHLLRKSDIIARWGGEEFVILTPHTNLKKAVLVAEKIRKSISETFFDEVGQVTASFGVAERSKGEDFKSWFKRVDEALYSAKNNGRNRVESVVGITQMFHIDWNSDWESGNKIIDEQHKKMLELANKLFNQFLPPCHTDTVLSKFDELMYHVLNHFDYEEEMLVKISFFDVEEHKKHHALLINQSQALKESFINGQTSLSGFISFILDKVIMEHMLQEDILYFPYLKRHFG